MASEVVEEIELIDDDSLNVATLMSGLRAHWLLLLLAILVGGGAGYGLSYLMPVVYRAEALIAVNAEDQSGGGLRSLAGSVGALANLAGLGGGTSADQSRAATIAMLHSHVFLEKFVGARQMLPALFPERWDAQAAAWKPSAKGAPTVQEGADLLIRKWFSVSEDRKTGLITVRMDGTEREQIADWVNGLVAAGNAAARQLAIQRAEDGLKHLTAESANVDSVVVRQSIAGMIEAQLNRRMLANTRPDYAFQVIDPAQTPRIENRISPSRAGFAAIGSTLLLMIVGAWAVVRYRRMQTAGLPG